MIAILTFLVFFLQKMNFVLTVASRENPLLLSQCDRQSQEMVFIASHVSKDDGSLEGKIPLDAQSETTGMGLGTQERVLGWYTFCSAGILLGP